MITRHNSYNVRQESNEFTYSVSVSFDSVPTAHDMPAILDMMLAATRDQLQAKLDDAQRVLSAVVGLAGAVSITLDTRPIDIKDAEKAEAAAAVERSRGKSEVELLDQVVLP